MPMRTAHQYQGTSTRSARAFADWIHIFETGEHTDSNGNRRYWSADDLNSLVANHDASHPAPLVIGHPASDDPRYGQVSEYKLDAAGKLWFKAKDIEPTFEQMVADKRFPERSIAIDPDGQGGFKVRHIGFLGAVPPALQLTPMQYGLSGRPAYEYAGEFAPDATTPRVLGRAMRRLREFIVEYFGVDAADKVMPEYEVESIQEHATDLTSPPKFDSSTYYQPTGDEPMPETHHFTQAELDAAVKAAKAESQAAFAKDNAALKGELDKVRRERLAGAYQSQVDKAVSEGRLSPAQSEGLVEFMLALPDGADAPFTFSRGEDDKAEEVKQTPMQFFEAFIGKLNKQLDLDNEQGGAGSAPDDQDTASFALVDNKAVVDAERLALHSKALEYQRNHPNTDYIAAVKAVGG